jgi:lipopolysaccharide/colanic/teichoic acid biosynthesis glycosyltransferase
MQSSDFGTGLPRPVEFAASLAGLVILSPLIFIAMAATVLTSGGPVFFQQRRIGRLGQVFVLHKLRTMQEGSSGPNVTATGDSRITWVGRILRQTKIDEIPELWNVLRGDMSLVGPRPEVPCYVDLTIPEWQQVLLVRPGMTDPVTLRLRNEEKLMAGVKGDREDFYLRTLQPFKLAGYLVYLKQRTWWSDILIIFRTLICVLFPQRVPESGMNNELTQQGVTTFEQR